MKLRNNAQYFHIEYIDMQAMPEECKTLMSVSGRQ